ncbi:hypothetical protein [uncultured Megamonas sp.]|uniref:hypothetical protein n=1 Tax=uncultured Megamonas sp. TaxID=286140 RepID=UPI0025947329|nr:hypothetical protein [uncultured Megamonas sp.]
MRMSLIIASSTQFSPKVFKYWERYCKAEWDARYTVQCLAASNTTAIIKYAGSEIYVTIDLISDGNNIITSTKAELS